MEFGFIEEFKFLTQERLNIFCDISLCRICLEKVDPTRKTYDIFAEGDVTTSNMIMSCASVQISESDGLPTIICHDCLQKLNIAWQFKMLCENSDAKLREAYLGATFTNIDMSQHDDLSPSSEMCVIKNTCNESDYISKTNNFNNTFNSETDKLDVNSKKNTNSLNESDKKKKVHQCETCGKVFNRREYLTQHLRIHTGEKPYCCHLCDKRFINSGHLLTHLRKHTGEKPHQCSLCRKSFTTKQELTKHTMVHNGEKPYICTSCGKQFVSSSNLYTHMKHHTGEKKFICEHCSKRFYTKQELKQHQVTHTGEKAFVCEYCKKRFSQIAHLRRHIKLHSKTENAG